ncbi:hypothetical protein IKU74_04835 [bacterium]|nr:hypothetical protein [bacterium]
MENAVNISPSISGAASALVGLGAGYAVAPRKYSLERLLMQNEDSFERTFSKETMTNASVAEKEALENLKTASKIYFSSGQKILKDEISPNAKKWYEMISEIPVNKNLVDDVKIKRNLYLKSLEDNKYYELKNNLKVAQEKALANPKDVNLNLELKDAARKFADVQLAVEPSAKQYRMAREAFRNARDEAMLTLPDKGKAISVQWDKVRRAMSDRANLMYEKLSVLSKSNDLGKDYNLVRKYIPKARTASALTGGILSGMAGILVGVYSVNKLRNT